MPAFINYKKYNYFTTKHFQNGNKIPLRAVFKRLKLSISEYKRLITKSYRYTVRYLHRINLT